MTVGQRFLLTLAIVLAILLLLAAVGFFTGNWDEDEAARPGYGLASFETRAETAAPLCMDAPTRERIKGIMLDALDAALQEQIQHLFLTWLKDERGQPGRARTGVEQAIRAHQSARKGALEWAPPECSG